MGYRSHVSFKTTTEGYVLFKKFDNSIEDKLKKPLTYARIQKTPSGFYKIEFDDVKWYDSYESVANFSSMLRQLRDVNIPFKFIRIGEDHDDIAVDENWTDDMPDEILYFDVERTVYDDDEGRYELIEGGE